MDILESVMSVNRRQPARMMALLRKRLPELEGAAVAVLGLAFKPGTDDMRESPAIPVVNALRNAGAHVQAYDPVARHEAERVFGQAGITYAARLQDAVERVDAVLLMTRWPEFEGLPSVLDELGSTPVVVDGRRMIAPDRVAHYEGIGAPAGGIAVREGEGDGAVEEGRAEGRRRLRVVARSVPHANARNGDQGHSASV
jgi:UDPglucose 6-dehydrogenase/GDP-mannose 6-dehydrogenase